MATKKPRIVIIGAGMAGLTAASKLCTSPGAAELFDLCVVEGGTRIGGRINTSEFGGDRIEMGATWIHGIGGSPVYKIAQEIQSLDSDQPWECMDGFLDDPLTVFEGGFEPEPSLVQSVSTFFNKLMDFAQGKSIEEEEEEEIGNSFLISARNGEVSGKLSIGSFLRRGLESYWDLIKGEEGPKGCGNRNRKLLEEAIFAMLENTQRTYTGAGDLLKLDFSAEKEYIMFPGEEVTIAKGYTSIIKFLASVLPPDSIQLGRKVVKIEWQPERCHQVFDVGNGGEIRPVRLHFSDGSDMVADHVIVTVSLGVLKAGIQEGGSGNNLFDPPLPGFKAEAISRLGYGVVNKLFLQLSTPSSCDDDDDDGEGGAGDGDSNSNYKFPFLQMAFHRSDSEFRRPEIPWWMRRTASLCPIYAKSNVLLSWFAGKEALELESLEDEKILSGVSTTISTLLSNSHELCNGDVGSLESSNGNGREWRFSKVLKSEWGTDPLFLGSYSYVAVGSGGDDLDAMAVPLPKIVTTNNNSSSNNNNSNGSYSSRPPLLQILFAGEATHRTHYSTTHGAYLSGLREANRLLQYYQYCNGV